MKGVKTKRKPVEAYNEVRVETGSNGRKRKRDGKKTKNESPLCTKDLQNESERKGANGIYWYLKIKQKGKESRDKGKRCAQRISKLQNECCVNTNDNPLEREENGREMMQELSGEKTKVSKLQGGERRGKDFLRREGREKEMFTQYNCAQ